VAEHDCDDGEQMFSVMLGPLRFLLPPYEKRAGWRCVWAWASSTPASCRGGWRDPSPARGPSVITWAWSSVRDYSAPAWAGHLGASPNHRNSIHPCGRECSVDEWL